MVLRETMDLAERGPRIAAAAWLPGILRSTS